MCQEFFLISFYLISVLVRREVIEMHLQPVQTSGEYQSLFVPVYIGIEY